MGYIGYLAYTRFSHSMPWFTHYITFARAFNSKDNGQQAELSNQHYNIIIY